MAKGNDGNYLQHSVEIEVALNLASRQPEGRLHIALTHDMAPFEPSGEERSGQAWKKLKTALDAALGGRKAGESSIVTAYRSLGASMDHYPNTAELLRASLGAAYLTGGITECEKAKCRRLQQAWSGTGVEVSWSSWRSDVGTGGVLTCPATLDTPWLFSMDPMTYRESRYADDAYLYRADLDRLSGVLGAFVQSGQPGVAALFVYSVMPPAREQFWAFVDELAGRTGTQAVYCWLAHRGGNRNLAGLLCGGFELPDSWVPYGVSTGR